MSKQDRMRAAITELSQEEKIELRRVFWREIGYAMIFWVAGASCAWVVPKIDSKAIAVLFAAAALVLIAFGIGSLMVNYLDGKQKIIRRASDDRFYHKVNFTA